MNEIKNWRWLKTPKMQTHTDELTGEVFIKAWRKDGQEGHILEVLDGIVMFWPYNGTGAELHRVEALSGEPIRNANVDGRSQEDVS